MQFRILGPMEVADGDRVLELGGARQRLLLARLAVAGNRVVSVDTLVGDLWADDAPLGAKEALQAQVSRVRKVLSDRTRLVARPPGYLLQLRPGELDAEHFEALAGEARAAAGGGDVPAAATLLGQAERLWRGPALAEFVEYPFAQAEAARLENLRMATLEERLEFELAMGRHRVAANELETVVTAYPFRERLWALWMLALYRCGRQAEALAAYQRLRQILGEELGIEPGEEVASLEEAILLHKPELTWVGPAPRAHPRLAVAHEVAPLNARSAPTARLRSLRLVGRRRERDALVNAFAAAAAGAPTVVVVVGEAGIGKTRLVAEVAEAAAAEGAVVLAGGCPYLAGTEVPYAPLAEAFRRHLRALEPAAARDLVTAAGGALARVVPELAEDDIPAVASRTHLHGLLFQVLRRLADDDPVVLVLEDLHWADASTAALVEFVARNLGDERLVVVVTLRSDELRSDAGNLIAALARCPTVRRVDLGPLHDDDVAQLARAIACEEPEAELVDRVVASAEGNPLFVEELVAGHAQGAHLPSTLRGLLVARVHQLSGAAAACATALAVAGRPVTHSLLAKASAQGHDELIGALREAVDHHVVMAEADGYQLRHALVGEALYDYLLPGERAVLHARLAEALVALPSEGTPGELAHHWLAAGELGRALTAAVHAAEAAERSLAGGEAVAFYERALELWDRVRDPAERAGMDRVALLERAADAAALADTASYALGTVSYRRAITFAEEAVRAVDNRREPVRAGLLHARLGQYLWSAGREGRAHSEQALRLIPPEPVSLERARALASYARGLTVGYHKDAALPFAQEAIELAEKLGARSVELDARITYGTAVGSLGDVETGSAELEGALRLAEEVGSADDVLRGLANLWHLLWSNDRLDEAFAVLSRGDKLARRLGFEDYWLPVRVAHTAVHFLEAGRWDECEHTLVEFGPRLPGGRPGGRRLQRVPEGLLVRAFLAAARGDAPGLAEARSELQELTDGIGHEAAWMAAAEAELALWLERPNEARKAVAAGLVRLGAFHEPQLAAVLCLLGIRAEADEAAYEPGVPRAAGAAEGHENVARAQPLLERLRSLAAVAGATPAVAAMAATAEAEFSRLAVSPDPERWRRALRAWGEVGRPYPLAWVQWRAGEAMLLACGPTAEAARLVEAARQTAEHLALTPLLARLDALVARAGVGLGVKFGTSELRSPP